MSALLKALAWVAPQAAMRRVRALASVDAARAYEGAKLGRRGASLTGRGSSANVEVGAALARLRDRSRDLVRNTAAGARVMDIIVAHAVGTGIVASWNTGSDRADRQVTALWEGFVRSADAEGELDFNGLQALALRSMLEGGDALVRLIRRPLRSDRRFPLMLQVLEGDHLDTSRNADRQRGRTRLGVELGEWNERIGYWLLDQHPGEGHAPGAHLIGRADLVHLYRPLRAGQVRGVPVLAPVIMTARDIADLMDAMIVKARIEACFSGFITSTGEGFDTPLGQPVASGDGRAVIEMAPGMVRTLLPGQDIKFAQPSGAGQYEPVMLSNLMAFAAGAGITYDQLTGDLRQANYSSLRAGKIEFRRQIEQLQWLNLVPMFLARVATAFVETAMMAGLLRERSEGYACDWVMPAVEPIDPKKDLEADIAAVRAGRMSPQEFIAAWGRDWRKVTDDFASFLQAIDDKGLALDIDPRRPLNGATPPAAAADEDGASPGALAGES